MKKRKIFMISYYFPPINVIGAIRNYHMAHFFKKDFDLHIYSSSNRFNEKINDIDVSLFNIKYLKTFDYRTIRNYLQKNKKKNTGGTSVETKKVILFRKLSHSFPFNLIFGEGGLLYILHGVLLGVRYVKSNAVIYSSYSPVADHYIAYILKKIKPGLFWIADYRDPPYIHKQEQFIFSKFQKKNIHHLIRKADTVMTVSQGLNELYFQPYNKNSIVIRNAISDILFHNVTTGKKDDKFIISYTGSLYKGKRDASLLFKSIRQLINDKKMDINNIQFVYAGNDSSIIEQVASKYDLSNIVVLKGSIKLEEALKIQITSDINLLLTWSNKYQKGILTGKFFEYLKADRPILLIINGDRDSEFEYIMSDINAGCVCYQNQEEKLIKFLIEKYDEWLIKGTTESQINSDALQKYTWDYQYSKLINHIKKKRFNNV